MVKYLVRSVKETIDRVIFMCPECGYQTTVSKNKYMHIKTKLKHHLCLGCSISEHRPLIFDIEYFDKFGNLIDSESM